MDKEAFGGNNAESYYDEGLSASMKGDLHRAVHFFNEAIKLDKSYASAYHQMGKCYLRLGNIDRAITMLGQVTKARPKMQAALIDLGSALILNDNDEGARATFKRVLELNPGNRKAFIGLSQACFAHGDWEESLDYAQQAQEDGGQNFSTCYMIGRSAKIVGKTEISQIALKKADSLMDKFQELNEEKPEGHFLRGEVAFVQERFSKALDYYRKAEDRIDPDTFYLAYGESFSLIEILAKQGLCLQRLEKQDRAHEIGLRIQSLSPDHPIAKALLDSPR